MKQSRFFITVSLMTLLSLPAVAQKAVPRVLDEPMVSPSLRGTISQPAYNAQPRAEALPQPIAMPEAPVLVPTSPALKRRTGKNLRVVRRTNARLAPADGRMMLRNGSPPPVLVARNEGPGRALPNANPYVPGAAINPQSGEIIMGQAPQPAREAQILTVEQARTRLDDPAFAASGLRLGAFTAVPFVEGTLGYDSNLDRRNSDPKGSMFEVIAGGVEAQSDWQRHALSLSLRGAYTDFRADTRNNRPELSAALRGRIDLSREARIELETRYNLLPRPWSGADALAFGQPSRIVHTQQIGAGAGLVRDINRLQLSLRGSVDHFTHENTPLEAGGFIKDAPTNYTAYGLRLRGQYDLNGQIMPFVEGGYNHRHYADGLNTNIYTLRAGFAVQHSAMLVGEVSAGGFLWNDPRRDQLRGAVIDASLAWMPSELTTLTLKAGTALAESNVSGATSVEQRDLSAQLDHAFRRHLIGTLRAAIGFDAYRGIERNDRRMTFAGGVTYKFSRSVSLRGELRHERLTSSVAGQDYTANVAMLGLRLQR